jgi:large subunit ribosomal protein L30
MSREAKDKVLVKQVRGVAGRPEHQRLVLKALGLGRIGRSREHLLTPSIEGMIRKVNHLVEIEKIS